MNAVFNNANAEKAFRTWQEAHHNILVTGWAVIQDSEAISYDTFCLQCYTGHRTFLSDKSQAYKIGYADTMHGINTFPTNGSDDYSDVNAWAQAMKLAAEKCRDEKYAQGVLCALKEKGL